MAYRSPTETGQSNGTRALLKASPSQVGDLSLQPSTRVMSSKESRMDVEEIIARTTFATAPEPAPHAPLYARKFPPIAGMPLSDFRPIPLPLFAIQRLSQMKYVPYWYATHEGRMDALQRVTAPDAGADDLAVQLHFDDSLDTHVLVPVSTRHTPSPNVIPDDQLTIEQLTQGKSSFCGALKTLGWDQTHVLAHALLIARIESHATLRESPYAERALMHYFAEVRREYHAALASNAQNVPDISIINERRIQDFIFDLHMKDMTETLNEAQCKLSALLPASETVSLSQDQSARLPSPLRSRTRNRYAGLLPKSKRHPITTGAATAARRSACAVCLGRHRHSTRDCAATHLQYHPSQPVYVRRGSNQLDLFAPSDEQVCLRFNIPAGCPYDPCVVRHICSGCGSVLHGAQDCHLGQVL